MKYLESVGKYEARRIELICGKVSRFSTFEVSLTSNLDNNLITALAYLFSNFILRRNLENGNR